MEKYGTQNDVLAEGRKAEKERLVRRLQELTRMKASGEKTASDIEDESISIMSRIHDIETTVSGEK